MKKNPEQNKKKFEYAFSKIIPSMDSSSVSTPSEAELENLLTIDLEVLAGCDLMAGHLLQYEGPGGGLNSHSIRIMHEKGSLHRLLDQGLIHADGKLTEKGIRLCRNLKAQLSVQESGGGDDEGCLSIKHEDEHLATIKKIQGGTGAASNQIRTTGLENEESTMVIHHRDALPPEKFTMPASGQYPHKNLVEESLVAYLDEESFEAEQIKILKTSILFPINGRQPRSLLITSTGPGDGKSFVSANLAVSMASNINTHVLLIDCDLRKPTLHKVFGLQNSVGLADYLSEGSRIPLPLQKTVVERLTVLTAGSRKKNPAELLSSPRMTSLIKETTKRQSNRFVILDSPPSNMTAESVVLSRLVDGILMVVKFGKTRLKDLQQAVTKHGKEKFFGSVLNGYEHSIREYYCYKRYPGYAAAGKTETASAQAGCLRPAASNNGG